MRFCGSTAQIFEGCGQKGGRAQSAAQGGYVLGGGEGRTRSALWRWAAQEYALQGMQRTERKVWGGQRKSTPRGGTGCAVVQISLERMRKRVSMAA